MDLATKAGNDASGHVGPIHRDCHRENDVPIIPDIGMFASLRDGNTGISPGMVKTAMTKAMPIMDNKPEADWVAPERAAELCVFLASGQADRLSGRYVHVLDDIRELVRRAEEVAASDLYALRVRKL